MSRHPILQTHKSLTDSQALHSPHPPGPPSPPVRAQALPAPPSKSRLLLSLLITNSSLLQPQELSCHPVVTSSLLLPLAVIHGDSRSRAPTTSPFSSSPGNQYVIICTDTCSSKKQSPSETAKPCGQNPCLYVQTLPNTHSMQLSSTHTKGVTYPPTLHRSMFYDKLSFGKAAQEVAQRSC